MRGHGIGHGPSSLRPVASGLGGGNHGSGCSSHPYLDTVEKTPSSEGHHSHRATAQLHQWLGPSLRTGEISGYVPSLAYLLVVTGTWGYDDSSIQRIFSPSVNFFEMFGFIIEPPLLFLRSFSATPSLGLTGR